LQDPNPDPDRCRPPWRSRSSWPLKVSLTDSISCRSGRNSHPPARWGSSLRAGRNSRTPSAARPSLELAAVVVLVGHQDLSWPQGHQLRLDRQELGQHLAVHGVGTGQRKGDREPMAGAHQVQPQPPEPARIAGTPAVGGPSGQLRAPRGLPGAATLTGVESASQRSSVHSAVSLAMARMAWPMCPAARRRLL
jgi:hypothetical protein